MKWISRALVLPILFSVSLTTLSATLLYLLYTKDDESNDSELSGIITSRCTYKYSIQYTVPRQHISAIIGKRGSVIKDIQNKTGTEISINDDNIKYYTCVIQGNIKNIHLAKTVIERIIHSQPKISIFTMDLPHKVCKRIIGRYGETLHQIQIRSKAKVTIEYDHIDIETYNYPGRNNIEIEGTHKQIRKAFSQINDKINEIEEQTIQSVPQTCSVTRLHKTAIYSSYDDINLLDEKRTCSLTPDSSMKVYISAMKTPSRFWIQVDDFESNALDELVNYMTSSCNDPYYDRSLEEIIPGQIVAAQSKHSDQWYRAEVIAVLEHFQCELYFVDYGDYEIAHTDNIIKLHPDLMKLPFLAIECSLANIKPRENEWSSEACDMFGELISISEWRIMIAKVRGYKKCSNDYNGSRYGNSLIPCIDLYDKNDDKDINIGQTLVYLGFAQFEESDWPVADSTLLLSPCEFPFSSVAISTPPFTKYSIDHEVEANVSKMANTSMHVKEINLTTSQKEHNQLKEIQANDGKKSQYAALVSNQANKVKFIAPAGYESESDDTDEFEMG